MDTPVLFILHLPFLESTTLACAQLLLQGLPSHIPFYLVAPKRVVVQCQGLVRSPHRVIFVDQTNGLLLAIHKITELNVGVDFIFSSAGVAPQNVDWFERLGLEVLALPQAGIIGVKTLTSQHSIYSLGRRVVTSLGILESCAHLWWNEEDLGQTAGIEKIDSVAGTLCYIRRTAYDAVLGFDPRFCPWKYNPLWAHAWLEFDDFSLRLIVQGFEVKLATSLSVIYAQPQRDEAQQQMSLNAHAASFLEWEKKWGWHPKYPELHRIRQQWGETPLCRWIGKTLLDQWGTTQPQVDIVILTYNDLVDLKQCISYLAKTDYPHATVWVLDHGCTDETPAYLETLHQVLPFPVKILKAPINMGIPAANNWMIQATQAPVIAFLDSDAFIPPHWLSHLVETLREHPYAGVVGVKIVDRDEPQNITWSEKSFWNDPSGAPIEIDTGARDYVARTLVSTGCCQVYRRKVFEIVGPFDIHFGPISLCDAEHHLASRISGYDVLYDGYVTVRHTSRKRLKKDLNYIQANQSKIAYKWGEFATYILDKTLDLAGRRETFRHTDSSY